MLKPIMDLNDISGDLMQTVLLFPVTQKSCGSKYFIFYTALIPLCRPSVVNQY